jgi:Zn-dependent peptidase ImmA (M78 family)
MYDSRTDTMKIPNSIFWGMRNRIPYCRFSVAHEIAHAILGHGGIRFRHAEKRAYEKANPDIRRDEREAEQFAAILLAPTHLAKKCKSIEEVKERFGLSDRAAEIRAKEIEAHLRREKGEKPALTQKVVDFLKYAESKGYRTSKVKVDLDSTLIYREAVAKDRECVKNAQPSAARLAADSPTSESSTASKTQYLREICNVCRQPKVFPLGPKSKCDNCGTRFQDGDP